LCGHSFKLRTCVDLCCNVTPANTCHKNALHHVMMTVHNQHLSSPICSTGSHSMQAFLHGGCCRQAVLTLRWQVVPNLASCCDTCGLLLWHLQETLKSSCRVCFPHQTHALLPALLLCCLFLQHHVNPEHAAHHAAVAAKDVAYDGSDGTDVADVLGLPSRGNGTS
jgi:hypothetical protein